MIEAKINVDLKAEMNKKHELKRAITWKDGFWLSSGVPMSVLITIGAIAAVSGKISWLVFILSILIGFSQSLTYAEIAGIFPNKSGGASVYGAMAWIRYNRFVAPLSTWTNWFAWSPVLAVASGLASSYIINLFPETSLLRTWQLTLLNLGWLKDGLTFRISATWLLAVIILLSVFAIQHTGVARAAKVQKYLSLVALLVLLVVAAVPIVTGHISKDNVLPLIPSNGFWNMEGWGIFLAAMFLAGYSTYSFETAVCYVREFRDPKKDTFKALLSVGLLCLFMFFIVPFAFQGFYGMKNITAPGIQDGTGVGAAMASMVGSGKVTYYIFYLAVLFILIVSLMTAMAGSSRTIYQASLDGWFPKYLSKANKHGAPVAAMWTDMVFNILLLMMSDYFFIVVASNVCYMIFVFLNLHSGWIHRMDNGDVQRSWRTPTWLIGLNAILAYLNIGFLGAAAHVLGKGMILSGFLWAMLIIPVFFYRHYVTDKGVYPEHMYGDLNIQQGQVLEKKAGYWPNIALAGGLIVFIICYLVF
jgi:Amino acid transporters